jgi:hypothetical protein
LSLSKRGTARGGDFPAGGDIFPEGGKIRRVIRYQNGEEVVANGVRGFVGMYCKQTGTMNGVVVSSGGKRSRLVATPAGLPGR